MNVQRAFLVCLLLPWACSGSGSSDGDAGDATGDVTGDEAAGPDIPEVEDMVTDGSEDPGEPDETGGDEWCPVTDYVPCGGDIVGTWAYRGLCPEDPEAAAALCEHPYEDRPVCTGTGNEAVCDSTDTGTLIFYEDLSIDIETHFSMVTTYNFTDQCLEAVAASGATPEERCAAMSREHLACAYAEQCTCVSDPMVEDFTNTATYVIVDNEVTIGEDPPSTYCIEGDILTMDFYLFHPVSWRYWVLERQ
jgi:hypothetical protein